MVSFVSFRKKLQKNIIFLFPLFMVVSTQHEYYLPYNQKANVNSKTVEPERYK